LFTLNLKYKFVESLAFIFVWTMQIGVHQSTSYTNFLFLAVTKTNLPQDMQLNYYERELVVNLLLMANEFGALFATVCGYIVMTYLYPDLLFNPP